MQRGNFLVQSERDLLVQRLVIDSIDKLQADHLSLWLQSILEYGFVGFANMNEEALRRECSRRGLRFEEHFDEPPREEYDDGPEEEDDELLDLLSMARSPGESAFS
jgi:hypothetical protein